MDLENNRKIPTKDDNYTHNIDKANERKLDRRGFLKTMVGAAGVFAVSTLPWGVIAAKELTGGAERTLPKKKIADIASVSIGEAVEFSYPGEHDTALLIRLGETNWRAYQNACTHLRCPVFWKKEKGELLCPCHHGKFDPQSGSALAGPPRRPLPTILLQQEEGTIYAIGVKHYEA